MGETGSVSFMFDRVGEIAFPAAAGSEDAVMEAAIEAGAQDVESDPDGHLITTTFEDLSEVAGALEAKLGAPKSVEIVWRPKTGTPVSGDAAATLMKLIDALDDDEDVQTVYANYEIDETELAALTA